jgi:uncharacterized protein YbjT (DUF2867 family)
MKVILFGATGMVGQGVLRECLLDPEVERVLSIVRTPSGVMHEKLTERVHADFYDYTALEPELKGYDACFFCLGASAAGMKEADYHRVTYDLTLAAANLLARLNPGMSFIYVSGAGTDSSEKGRSMWARVKGQTENAIMKLPFRSSWMFRPGIIQPKHGARSKTTLYRTIYIVFMPLMWLLKAVAPGTITTTEKVGRAMLVAAKRGAPKQILSNNDINALGA